MLSDIEIAQGCTMKPVREIAADAGIAENYLELYGNYKAKVDLGIFRELHSKPNGKLIYVTAITPTPAGEGKTCTAVGVAQALGLLGKRVMLCLREPSLGPVFGIKGGATGGGYSQVLPMDEINLHFTGDIHAVTSAHNLLAAMVDNHLHHGNELRIDPKRVVWRRVMDISDRQLRRIVVGLGSKGDGVMRESGFDITVASEIMAILCLAGDMADLKARLGRILVAYNLEGAPVYARDLKAAGALTLLMKDALKPNLVQTIEGQPVLIHGGPFANIAHGNNSIIATRMGLKLADYVVTEGGFASDLGAEKFFDIVCRQGLKPDTVVLVASVRALKSHGGVEKSQLGQENLAALVKGCSNLERHIANLRGVYRLPVVVAINRFPSDTEAELEQLAAQCRKLGVRYALSEVVAKGGEGGRKLAGEVLASLQEDANEFQPAYHLESSLKEKIAAIATRIYGADGVDYAKEAEQMLTNLTRLGYGELPVCIAKTQNSLSDDPNLKGAPTGWRLTVKEIRLLAGAGFVVAIAGQIMTMPGLPKEPAAEKIDVLEDGTIVGLF